MKILITGAAGFIGARICEALLARGETVIALDNMHADLNLPLKQQRIEDLQNSPNQANFEFLQRDITNRRAIADLFALKQPDAVVHLAGNNRDSDPEISEQQLLQQQLGGLLNVLEGCRSQAVGHLLYASSSDLYYPHQQRPMAITEVTDHPSNLISALAKSAEQLAHSYSAQYGLPATGVRLFRVYGPGDNYSSQFSRILQAMYYRQPIPCQEQLNQHWDFTYIDDVTQCLIRLLDRPAKPEPQWRPEDQCMHASYAPWRIYNLGSGVATTLAKAVAELEVLTGLPALIAASSEQQLSPSLAVADVTELQHSIGIKPQTPIAVGLKRFWQSLQ